MLAHRYTPLKQSVDDSEHDSFDQCQRSPTSHSRLRSSVDGLSSLDDRTQEEITREIDAHAGVIRVEATRKVYGRTSKWILFISLGMAAYIYSLDSSTTSNYLSFAASAFGEHSLISSVGVVQSLIIAIGKPVIAKVADVTSRAYAYLGVLIFYVLGYIVIASAGSIAAIFAGIVLYAVFVSDFPLRSFSASLTVFTWVPLPAFHHIPALCSRAALLFHSTPNVPHRLMTAILAGNVDYLFALCAISHWDCGLYSGYTGLQLLTQIIIADLTTLKWRALVSSLTSLPFIVNGIIGPNIAAAVIENSSWRWGYGMFAILVPATLLPLILTLFWAERKAKRLGIVADILAAEGVSQDALVSVPKRSLAERMRHVAEQLDLLGLVLLGSAIALILLPLTLTRKAKNSWRNPYVIAMLALGVVLMSLFAIWDLRHASRPVIAPRFLRNKTVVIASVIGFIDFCSFFLTFIYLQSFVLVVKPWTTLEATYFMQAQTMALTVAGFFAGVLMWKVRRCKVILMTGLWVRLLGCALMIHSRGAQGSSFEIVMTQVLQGLGGGFAAVANQVAAQASIPHADVAMVTAVLLLLTEIGGGVGSAIAGAMWTASMPRNLAKTLPQLSEEERRALYGSITDVLSYPRGHPIREGVISAYDTTMKTLVVVATVMSIAPIVLSFGMPDWYLGDTQNAVDDMVIDEEEYTDDQSQN